jgi:NADH-quinone oxidoreductase subunit H
MNAVDIVLTLVKIVIILGFVVTGAALGTWADRRQGAMIQDRVGPNRAVFHLPSGIARVVVLLPPALFGVIAAFQAWPEALARVPPQGRAALESFGFGLHLAILFGWMSLALLAGMVRKNGPINKAEEAFASIDPRNFVYAGLMLHAAAFVIQQLIPASVAPLAARVANGVLALVLFAIAIYAASRVPDGKVPVRLAGLLHPMADGIKLVWKEDFVPKNADKLLHALAPIIAMFPVLVVLAVVPFGDSICLADDGDKVLEWGELGRFVNSVDRSFACAGHTIHLQIADLNVGMLYIFAIMGTSVIGAALAGVASDNKFSLLGGLRAASQMVSYEVAMGLSLVGVFLIYGSVRLRDMVEWQANNAWGIFVQPLGFVLFLAAMMAETKRTPFDQVEAESEIVAGHFVEYSGMKFGMFYLGEYAELVTSSVILTTLFFGGFHLPFLHRDGLMIAIGDWTILPLYKMNHLSLTVLSVLAFFAKVSFVTWVQVFFRWTLPRFRYDQLMQLGWLRLLPLSIANLVVTGVIVLAIDGASPGVQGAFKTAADVTQAIVAALILAGGVAIFVGLLEPASHKRFLRSTSARFATAMGKPKASPQQA